ncbi:hypothetical protein FWK35_00027108, partial [Aphis craccivora]
HAYVNRIWGGVPEEPQRYHTSDSERSEECIDFTIIITSRNNAPISNYGGVFKKIEKNKKKNDGIMGIFTQNQFSTKSIFFLWLP